MNNTLRDPLLLIGQVLAIFLQIIMAIATIGLLIAVPAVLLAQGYIDAEIAKETPTVTEPFPAMWLAAVMAIGCAMTAMLFMFFGKLRRIIGTVGEGDPFQPENAGRLSMMAWLMLGVHLALIPAAAVGLQIARYAEQFEQASFSMNGEGFDLTGILLIVILFILARVFRHGAAMREDLEGTV